MRKIIIICISATFSLFNCIGKKGEIGPAGTSLLGTISGYVELYKTPYTKERSFVGATVTAFNATTTATGITDSIGRYQITNLKTGTYNIMASKDTFGIYRQYGFQLIGGDLPAFAEKMKISRLHYGVILLKETNITLNEIGIGITSRDSVIYTPFDNLMRRMFYVSKNKEVSFLNYDERGRGDRGIFTWVETRDYIAIENIKTKFKSGDTLYIVCYPYNDSRIEYIIPEKQKYILEGVTIQNKSNVVKIVMP